MTKVAQRITVAEEAKEYIEQGSKAITPSTPIRILVYFARKYVSQLEQTQKRSVSRQIERRAAPAVRRSSHEIDLDIARKARRKAWESVLGVKFATGAGAEKTWGEATRMEHHERANAQRKLASAANDDAALHEAALADLVRFGIDRLGEL